MQPSAEELLNSDILRDAFKAAEEAVTSEWRRTRPEDSARREDLHADLRALERMQQAVRAQIHPKHPVNPRIG